MDSFMGIDKDLWDIGLKINKEEKDELRAEVAKLTAENAALREALRSVLPPLDGDYGGPLVAMYASYEDGSEPRGYRISRETIIKAEALIKEKAELRRVKGGE